MKIRLKWEVQAKINILIDGKERPTSLDITRQPITKQYLLWDDDILLGCYDRLKEAKEVAINRLNNPKLPRRFPHKKV